MAAALRHLGWRLRVLGSVASDTELWQGVAVEHGRYADPAWLAEADVVALPAHVEHSPRALLKALAAGLPVVATPACGLPSHCGAIEVPAGDVKALILALQHARTTRAPGGRPAAIADACGEP
jgi:glycosyltransferase involved in cell wall biosynthesis